MEAMWMESDSAIQQDWGPHYLAGDTPDTCKAADREAALATIQAGGMVAVTHRVFRLVEGKIISGAPVIATGDSNADEYGRMTAQVSRATAAESGRLNNVVGMLAHDNGDIPAPYMLTAWDVATRQGAQQVVVCQWGFITADGVLQAAERMARYALNEQMALINR
jgi:hypothetical protein